MDNKRITIEQQMKKGRKKYGGKESEEGKGEKGKNTT